MTLNPNTANTVKASTASTSQSDHEGKRASAEGEMAGSNGVTHPGSIGRNTAGVLCGASGWGSLGSGIRLDGSDMTGC